MGCCNVVCLSETYHNASISNDNDSLEVPGYNIFIRTDHRSNSKRGGDRIHYRNTLFLKILGIQYLQECINFEIIIGAKLCRFISLYRSPNQLEDCMFLSCHVRILRVNPPSTVA